jgi:putative tryptophan/tyrosine transport system substrate-binding protein
MMRRLSTTILALAFASAQFGVVHADEPPQRTVRLGFVGPLSPATHKFTPFWERLRELGWIEGRNLVVDSRSGDGDLTRLPAMMAEILRGQPDVLVTYGTPGAIAAKKATSTVPIVAWAMSDPVRTGVAFGLARPGGNLTGLSMGYAEGLAGKFLEILHEAVPRLSTVAVIVKLSNPMPRDLAKDMEALAPARNLKLHSIDLTGPEAIEDAFRRARQRAQAVVVIGEPITLEHRQRVTDLAARHRLPAIYLEGSYVKTGGLISYGPDYDAMWRRGADYVDKILRGAKPDDLPIEQPTRYLLTVNLKTAQALGLVIPESILLRADEVIR